MAPAIANLQASATDGSAGTNSEVEQLNLLTSGTVQSLEMQQTSNNVLTSLLEQQTIANKIQRDALADHLNYETLRDQYLVSEGPQWGTASQRSHPPGFNNQEEFMLHRYSNQTTRDRDRRCLRASLPTSLIEAHRPDAEQPKVNNLMQHLGPTKRRP